MSETPKDAKGIFLAALDVPDAAERAAFVARSCESDEILRRRVEDLLHAFSESDGPLDKLPAALAATGIHEPLREQVGSTIGPYKLMEQIGEGGFGLVFVAEQQQPLRRKVALKIIKPGMDTRDVIARFEAERQALALMDHPNIARVLDAGTTASGRPYFVMELVRGMPITDFCDQSQLTPRERLSLFVDVCNAVQHAHQKGIIHRDIKPSNVLVTLHDDRPVVKVIDFGVAKALHQRLTEKTIYTRLAQMVGTPLYMSPEQAQRSGLDIDTRSDIYSLGVLLYELLTGTTPFDKRRLAKVAYDELLKMIREEDPPKPSVRLSQSTDSLPSIAAQRKTEPAKLSKMVHGDLDWIAMKALEKDRARRYETANAFAADVLRYLNDEPVEASPPSTAYRLRKFARKHRRPVFALTAVAAVLLLGIAGTTSGLFRARAAESRERTQRQSAEIERSRALEAGRRERQQREATEAERDRAERQFADGLLRPIGFSQTSDAAELHSFVDWSAIDESSLKSRVLEIAFENPETALRVARRAERAIQSCVGLSTKRRAHAIKLVAAKQRHLTADPRIRIAACWLAGELGSADLPAWAESCKWLSNPKNRSEDRFGEFVGFAASRSDPWQSARLDFNLLLAILEDPLLAILPTSSTSNEVHLDLCEAVFRLAPRLEPAQAQRAWHAVIAKPKGWAESNSVSRPTPHRVLKALAARLQPAEAERAWDAVVKDPEKWSTVWYDRWAVHDALPEVLEALAPKLEPAQVKRTGDVLIATLEKPADTHALALAFKGLMVLEPRLEPAQVRRVGDAAIGFIEKSRDDAVLDGPSSVLQALAPRLEPAQAQRTADRLIGILEKSTDPYVANATVRGLITLAPRLEQAQSKRAAILLIGILEKSTDEYLLAADGGGLTTFVQRLEPAQIKRACDAFITNPKRWSAFYDSPSHEALKALAARLEPAQAERAWHALFADPKKWSEWPETTFTWPREVLKALAARLEPAQAERAWNVVIADPKKWLELANPGQSEMLMALAAKLQPAQVKRTGDVLIAKLEKPADTHALAVAFKGLTVVEPRLEPAQVKRAGDAVIAILGKSTHPNVLNAADSVLTALVPRLEPAQLKRAADAAIAMLENSMDLNRVYSWKMCGAIATAPLLEPARVKRMGDAVTLFFEKSRDSEVLLAATSGLSELAPRLEPAQAKRVWDAVIAVLERVKLTADGFGGARAWAAALVALAPRLEPALRDNLATTATAVVLDYCSSFDFNTMRPSEVANSIMLARSISSPRSLAKLLSHPACVAEQREVLLKRFEELVFHDGKPVFLKPDTADGKKPADDQLPPRRFHHLHEAADWIQKNWPDFDLETSCPVTWRGVR